VCVQLIHVHAILVNSSTMIESNYAHQLQDLIEAVDYIPVHIGADTLKKTLYSAIIHKWNRWTNNFPLPIDSIIMRDKLWVILNPTFPYRDAIARNFFKSGKKGAQIFKSGKIIIHFHIPNEIYNTMLEQRDRDESEAEKRVREEQIRNNKIIVPDFVVGAYFYASSNIALLI